MNSANRVFPSSLALVLLLAFLALLIRAPAMAQTDAFSIEVAVSERSPAEERDAYAAALRRILLNNSGDKTILNRDLIREALRQAQTYVKAFSYRRPPPGTIIGTDTPITRNVQQTGEATQLMLVSFDRTLVSQLITDSAPANADNEPEPEADIARTSAVVWLHIVDQGRDIFVSDDAAVNVRQRAREIAGAAGLTLVYPVGDEEDRQLLVTADPFLETPTAENIAVVADRYAQETVLVGYMTRATGRGWISQWTQFEGDEKQFAEFETPSLDDALQQGLGMLGTAAVVDETYVYGGPASSDTEGLVWVGSLDSTEDYARMMRFFKGVDAVGTVYAKEVQATSMVFSVIPRSALVDIESALSGATFLRRSLPPVASEQNSLTGSADLAIEYTR